jgi:hypothetical protein
MARPIPEIRQDAQKSRLAGAVGTQKAQQSGFEFHAKIAQSPDAAFISFADIRNDKLHV